MSQFVLEARQSVEKYFFTVFTVELDANVAHSTQPDIRRPAKHGQFASFDVNFSEDPPPARHLY